MRCLAPWESLDPMSLELLAGGQQAASQGNRETNFPKGNKRERHQSWAAELCGQQLGPPLCAAQSPVSICRAEEAASSPTPPPKGHMHEGKPHQPRSRTTGTHVFRKVTSTSHGEKTEVENG